MRQLGRLPGPTLLLLGLLAGGMAQAHFLLNISIRVIHVEHLDNGLRVYLRVPMPLLVANLVGPEQADGTRVPAPYTSNRFEQGELMHYLDQEALRDDPEGLAMLVADGHELFVNDQPLDPVIEAIRVHPATHQPIFSNLEQARAALQGPVYPADAQAAYVGDTVVDVVLFYRTAGPVDDFAFASRLRPGIEGEERFANLLLDHAGGETKIYRAQGMLDTPITVSRSILTAAATFVTEGVRHILDGSDHVLFVLCLTIGAVTLGSLLWRVTGFTIGHTITLIAGFLGYAPDGAWFVPTVEAAIALSIIYAGVVALMKRSGAATFWITTAIGLLHGFGFAFVLQEILKIDSPNLGVSLLSFNLGVELGQIAIVLAVWPLLHLVQRHRPTWARAGRVAIALPCIAVAALWTGERLGLLIQQGLT